MAVVVLVVFIGCLSSFVVVCWGPLLRFVVADVAGLCRRLFLVVLLSCAVAVRC